MKPDYGALRFKHGTLEHLNIETMKLLNNETESDETLKLFEQPEDIEA